MIVITAPTSNIGSQVVADLLDAGESLRLIARDPSRLPDDVRGRVEVVEGSHGDAAVIEEAFAGDEVDTVFWLIPADPAAASVEAAYVDFTRPAAEAFVRSGIERVVGITALGRGTPVADRAGYVTASLAADDLIASSRVAYRALANPSFMDNVARQVVPIRDQGTFFTPHEPGHKLPTVATRDIAAAAARLLRDGSWTGFDEVPLLGPEDLSIDDQVQIMSEVLGRDITLQRVPIDAFKAQFVERGFSEPMAQGMADMYTAKDEGLDAGVERTPETATPTSFRQWCEEVLKPAVEG